MSRRPNPDFQVESRRRGSSSELTSKRCRGSQHPRSSLFKESVAMLQGSNKKKVVGDKRKRTSVEQLDAANLGDDVLGKDLVVGGFDLDLAVVRHLDCSGVLAGSLVLLEGRTLVVGRIAKFHC